MSTSKQRVRRAIAFLALAGCVITLSALVAPAKQDATQRRTSDGGTDTINSMWGGFNRRNDY